MKGRDLLILGFGLVFSAILRIRFSLHEGFEFLGFWITPPITFFSFSTKFGSMLTSTFIGNLLFFLFAILTYKETLRQTQRYYFITLFIVFIVAATGYEISQIISDYKSEFNNRHFHCGPLLFLIGLGFLKKNKVTAT